ncbi:MAG: polymerase [Caulobacteraceae bacterium]|nr:polymerase [Caulobacteraceae bacterium]
MTDETLFETARPLTQDGPPIRLFLVDGSGYIFRAYHALPPLTRKSDGMPVGAVSGFCNMLFKLLRDMKGEAPTHLAVIFDHSEKTFRNKLYDKYKAHRPPPPEDLVPQFPLVREATRAFGVPCLELPGYEADDLIAAYACKVRALGGETVIVSSDKDLMQLVGDGVTMLDTMKNIRIGPDQVFEKFGVAPDKVVDVQALCGDSVDNVPGAPGIGIKTASALINEYGDLDTLLARAGEIKQDKRRQTLIDFADQIRLSRALVTLDCDTPLPSPMDELVVREPDPAVLRGFLEDMGFRTLVTRVAGGGTMAAQPLPGFAPKPAEPAAAPAAETIDHSAYVCVRDLATLDKWVAIATAQGLVAFDTETDALSSATAGLCGVSLAVSPGQACYIPVGHCEKDGLSLEAAADLEQIPLREVIDRLKPLLEDPAVLKIAQNAKYDMAVMARYGVEVGPIDDTMLISYVLEGGLHNHGMDELSELHLGHRPIKFKEVAGSGKTEMSFKHVALEPATRYAAEDADVTFRLWQRLRPRLAAEGLLTVYETLERGMPAVLAAMENDGIRIDVEELRRLSQTFGMQMNTLEVRAHALAGRPFNLGSPKQIGDVLFGEMSLEGGKKTATGQWGTDSDVLETLAAQGHELPKVMLDWRQFSKLKGTYTDALPKAVVEATSRVHTSYGLAATPTGRLSSNDPNLQNIPVRTEEGRRIRRAFIAPPGKLLISADYSQIELRILAHIGDIPQLKAAFSRGDDIHAMTASEMFNVPMSEMTSEVRRRAKAINFGIVYGISAFGLANQLSIPREEAGAYIKTYFERFPGIRDYMDAMRAQVRETGQVTTLFGRRIHVPAAKGKSPAERAFGDRAAINAPIQGSAADIIRRAMIRMPAALKEARLSAKMLLQVHDELVFEAPADEAEATCKLVASVMEGAAEPAVSMSVPLVVEARAAANWDEAH